MVNIVYVGGDAKGNNQVKETRQDSVCLSPNKGGKENVFVGGEKGSRRDENIWRKGSQGY